MGEESEKKDPPPPSLSKPEPTPKPPSLGKAEPTPSIPPVGGSSGPPAVDNPYEKPKATVAEDPELQNGAIAPLNPRLMAAIIDALVAVGLYLAAVIVLPDIAEGLAWFVQAGYWLTRDSLPFLNGQSIGKTAIKLKAVKLDGSSLVNDWQTSLIRNIPLIIPFFGLIEAIVLISRDGKPEKGRRLGDDWAKTKVIVFRPEEQGE